MSTLVAIPVYNEADHIDRVLTEVRRYNEDILVINDGSTDGTAARLKHLSDIFVINHDQNSGYGKSLIDAFKFAIGYEYDWLITMDCDEQHEPSAIPDFLCTAMRRDADIISGSRYLDPELKSDRPPTDRRSINQHITALLNDLLGLSLTDAFCGFKAYRVPALRRLSPTVAGYAMPLQLWIQAARSRLRIEEIPVRLIYNDPNRTFGGKLDIPEQRLRHYMDVLIHELIDGAPKEMHAQTLEREHSTAEECCRC